jgi:hypothetical protein
LLQRFDNRSNCPIPQRVTFHPTVVDIKEAWEHRRPCGGRRPGCPLGNPVSALPISPIPTGPLPGPIVAPVADAGAPVDAEPVVDAAAVLPEPDAAPVEDAADVEAADVLAGDDVPAVAALIEDAGVAPAPPVPVVSDVGSLASMLPSALPVPSVPGLPVPLPQAVSVPHDFICAGIAWSASKSTPNAHVAAPVTAVVGRRDW